MRLLVDEDIASNRLLRALARERIDVVPPVRGSTDDEVWDLAQGQAAALLTMNARDFVARARSRPDHAGLLLVSRGNEPGDMTADEIAAAVAAIREAYPDGVAGLTLSVNAFRLRR